MRILVLSGKAGAGKTEAAVYLQRVHGFSEIAFADRLKDCVAALFGCSVLDLYDGDFKEQPIPGFPDWTWRKALQVIGTDLFRNQFDPEIWVKILVRTIALGDGNWDWVVSDARFGNEAAAIKKAFPAAKVLSLRIVRPGLKAAGIAGHESEKMDWQSDQLLVNNGGIEDLQRNLDCLVKHGEAWG
jgi:hypothetical protein